MWNEIVVVVLLSINRGEVGDNVFISYTFSYVLMGNTLTWSSLLVTPMSLMC